MMMTMQMNSTVQSQSLRMLQAARSASFKKSHLNPAVMAAVTTTAAAAGESLKLVTSTESTRLHLANLDKLLQTKQLPSSQPLQPPTEIMKKSNNEKKSKTILERLNLARVWPEIKATEEMSPRHLNRLQRLLSMTQERSPRNILGKKWREYHGCDDWKGMLDPLDENLRREVVRYGEFVQAAYQCFHSNPATSSEETPAHRHVALPDRSYRVTKSLYATSSVGMPSWVDDVAPDLGWMTQRSSWIGFVAVCDDRREIARMGRRDIVISLRGTATCLEWAENMRAHLSDMEEGGGAQDGAQVECGFQSLYRTGGAHVASLAESVREEVRRLVEMYRGEEISITVTGHSLGAALALLVADDVSGIAGDVAPVAVFSFGGPRVGNKRFGDRITDKNVKVLRIVNSQDVITRVPGMFVSDEVEQKLRSSNVGGVFDMLERNVSLGYTHVGTELRVDTKMSPYLKPDADMACCHDLEAYLHLVDGFMASNSPFRSNAKRSLVRLLKDQGSNIKQLYTKRAEAMSVSIERQTSFSMSTCCPSPS